VEIEVQKLREPAPQKNEKWIPIIIYRDGVEIVEVPNYQSAYRHLRPLLTCSITELRDAIADGIFHLKSWNHIGYKYDFRTYEERRQKFLHEIDKKKQTKK
jgi:hypothetical protein